MIFVHLGGEGDSELANLIGLRERLGNEVEDVDPNELGNGLVMTVITRMLVMMMMMMG